ncbi:MAG: hypothetical protein Q9170_004149 [Blastenia crenularia]
MYRVFISCLAVLSVCAARPAQNAPAALDHKRPVGFPIDYLAAVTLLRKSSGTLELPINPNNDRRLTIIAGWTSARTSLPKRAELVISLAVQVYGYWIMADDTPVTRQIRKQEEAPFQDFWHQITPVGNSLTTQKLGIAYCWALMYAVSMDITSANLKVTINEESHGLIVSIGSVDIIYNPAVRDGNTAGSTSQNSTEALEQSFPAKKESNTVLKPGSPNDALQLLPDEAAQRWFGCLNMLVFFIVQHHQSALVSITQPPLPPLQPFSRMYRFWRVPGDTSILDYVEITVFLLPSPRFMTWRDLMREVLVMGRAVALGQPYSTIGNVMDGTAVLARVQIIVDGGRVGGDVKNNTNTATA